MCEITVDAIGANGGRGNSGEGGTGGEAVATIPVTPGEFLLVIVGIHGEDASALTGGGGGFRRQQSRRHGRRGQPAFLTTRLPPVNGLGVSMGGGSGVATGAV